MPVHNIRKYLEERELSELVGRARARRDVEGLLLALKACGQLDTFHVYEIQQKIYEALADEGSPKVIEALLLGAKEGNSGAQYALVHHPSPEALGGIVQIMLHGDGYMLRSFAVAAIVKSADPKTIDPLISVVVDKGNDDRVRLAALDGLVKTFSLSREVYRELLSAGLDGEKPYPAVLGIIGRKGEADAVEPFLEATQKLCDMLDQAVDGAAPIAEWDRKAKARLDALRASVEDAFGGLAELICRVTADSAVGTLKQQHRGDEILIVRNGVEVVKYRTGLAENANVRRRVLQFWEGWWKANGAKLTNRSKDAPRSPEGSKGGQR